MVGGACQSMEEGRPRKDGGGTRKDGGGWKGWRRKEKGWRSKDGGGRMAEEEWWIAEMGCRRTDSENDESRAK